MKTKEEIIDAMRVLGNEASSQGLSMICGCFFPDKTQTNFYVGNRIELLGLWEQLKQELSGNKAK